MLKYLVLRLLRMFLLFWLISIIVFALIQLPPGDLLTSRINQMILEGTPLTDAEIDNLRAIYHLNEPLPKQYLAWIGDIVLRGDFGRSFIYDVDVLDIIGDRILTTVILSFTTILFTWFISFPAGVISAVKQYSWFDYLFSFFGFLGVSIPGFLLALVAIYTIFSHTGIVLAGLFSAEYANAPMSMDKIADLMKHVWLPIIIIGMHGTASLIRTIRGMMLDELRKPYVTAVRARGVPWRWVLIRYPMRVAIGPMLSTIGWMLPNVISGETIVATVLNLQTMGPVLLRALKGQDMYLAGSILLFTSVLSLIGTLLSDIMLALCDPRVRFGDKAAAE